MGTSLEETLWIGKEYYHFDTIDSTNTFAKQIAAQGCSHGTLVVAEKQEAGIGRRGRSWSSEKGAGIYMSLVLRPELKTDEASMLTLVAAISVAKAIRSLLEDARTNPSVWIKWPNDIVINGKKICGILTELSLKQREIDFIVIGIGINVGNKTFPEEISSIASSILLESGVHVEKKILIRFVWQQFETYYEQFSKWKDLREIRKEYEELLINKNKKVRVLDPLGEYEGIAKGITNTGELLVETDCSLQKVSGGEVSVRGIYGYV